MGIRLYGTSYFDLQKDKTYIKLLNKAFKKYGINNPISRLSDYKYFKILKKAEKQIAKDFGCKEACVFSSGYLAGDCIRTYLLEIINKENSKIVYNKNFHPSWYDEKMIKISKNNIKRKNLFISNSLNSFFGIKENYLKYINKFKLIAIDVSHTAYIWNHKKEVNDNILFFGSLNKASAFPAGFIAGNKKNIKRIRQLAQYTTSTPPSVAFSSVFLKMKKQRKKQRKKLYKIMKVMDKLVKKKKSIFPIYNIGINNDKLYKKFIKANLEISYMPYPYKISKKYLRIILNSNLEKSNLLRLKITKQ